jgi:hypothetical protein
MCRMTILLALALLAPAAPQAEHLHSPWDDRTITATDAPYQCPAPPEFAKILDAEPYYADSHASIIDPGKKAAYERGSESPTNLGQYAGLAADAYLLKGSRTGDHNRAHRRPDALRNQVGCPIYRRNCNCRPQPHPLG